MCLILVVIKNVAEIQSTHTNLFASRCKTHKKKWEEIFHKHEKILLLLMMVSLNFEETEVIVVINKSVQKDLFFRKKHRMDYVFNFCLLKKVSKYFCQIFRSLISYVDYMMMIRLSIHHVFLFRTGKTGLFPASFVEKI